MRDEHESREVDGGVFNLTTQSCLRCCLRLDWCKCRYRHRKKQKDGMWR